MSNTLSFLLIGALLSGCASFEKSIEQRVVVSEECRTATAIQPENWGNFGPIASIQLGNVGRCDLGGDDTLLPVCSLNKIALKHGLSDQNIFKPITSPEPAKPFDPEDKNVQYRDFNRAAIQFRNRFKLLAQYVKKFDDRYIENLKFLKPGSDTPVQIINFKLDELEELQKHLAVTRDAHKILRDVMPVLEAKLGTQARIELEAWDSNLRAQFDQFEQLMSGDYRLLLRNGLKDQVITHVARRSLELLHGSLKAPNAVITRLDSEAYGLISIGYLAFGPDIQRAAGKAFKNIEKSYAKRFSGSGTDGIAKIGIVPFLAEVRRSACTNLLEGTEFSMLSELVDTMLIVQYEPEASEGNAATGRSGTSPKEATIPPTRKGAASYGATPLYVKAIYQASVAKSPDSFKSESPSTVTPLAVYVAHEWAARQQLLEKVVAAKIDAASAAGKTRPFPDFHTVEENSVRRLADAATAKSIDDATWIHPSMLDLGSPQIGQYIASQVNVNTAASAVSIAAVTLEVNISVSNVNSFNPTNYNNVNPVINIPGPSAQPIPSLCAATDFGSEGAACTKDGDDYVVTFQNHSFGSDSCQVKDLEPALSAVGRRVADYRARHDVQYNATIHGFASRPQARLGACRAAATKDEHTCIYKNKLHASIKIVDCSPLEPDLNMRLSAARARNAAQVIERSASGAIVVDGIVARGTDTAQLTQDRSRLASDQTIVIRLQRDGKLDARGL